MGRLLSSVSCLSSFWCDFCILYFYLLPFLMCLRIQFYLLLFFIFSSYLFLFHSSMRSLIIFVFFFVHHLKKNFQRVPPTPILNILYLHPAFFLCLCILYSHAFILYSFCFLCILSVFIPYCIFFNLQIFILSFFVHLQIIFFKFSVHIHCLSWSQELSPKYLNDRV